MITHSTQYKVAERAGVSRTTVSLVLSGRANTMRFAPETIEKVLKAAEELGYHQNYAARTLKCGRSFTFGLITLSHSPTFFGPIAQGILEAARKVHYDMIQLVSDEQSDVGQRAVTYMKEKRIDGVIVVGRLEPEVIEEFRREMMSVVVVAPLEPVDLPVVRLDEKDGIRKSIDHLVKLGHRDLLWLAPAYIVKESTRTEAFEEAVKEADVQGRTLGFKGQAGPMRLDEMVSRYVKAIEPVFPRDDLPTGVVCWNDIVALALYVILRERGLDIPRDVSITGFDDIAAPYAWPPMTTVRHMFDEMGQAAVEMMMDMINSDDDPQFAPRMLPANLIVRQSTATPK